MVAADSLIRRRWDVLCGTESLVPIASMKRRVARWKEVSGNQIVWDKLDLTSLPDATADPVVRLARALVRVGELRFPARVLPVVQGALALRATVEKPPLPGHEARSANARAIIASTASRSNGLRRR